MPLVKKEPFEKHHDKEERKAKYGCGEDQGEEIVGLELCHGIQDRVTEAALTDTGRSGEEFAGDGTDDGDSARNADAYEEIRQRVWQAQLPQDLFLRGVVHEEELQ